MSDNEFEFTELAKKCSTCREFKPLSEFNKNRRFSDGLHYSCRSCTNEQKMAGYYRNHEEAKAKQREVRKNDPEKNARYNLQKRLKAYGMTPDDLNAMRDKQGGLCAICADVLVPGKHGEPIDHNHDTGEVRALLCGDCNVMIGYSRENPDRLIAGAAYLVRWTEKETKV